MSSAQIRERPTRKLDADGNQIVSFQVRWREPLCDESGAPNGGTKHAGVVFESREEAEQYQVRVNNRLGAHKQKRREEEVARPTPTRRYTPPKVHVLYRFFDEAHCLLYVGITTAPANRFQQHAADKPWWPEVSTITMCRYKNRSELHRAERDAIRTESPKHNTVRYVHSWGNGS